VGVSGYFIDLAVRHPGKPGTFLLGIEFDGKSYHSGRSARDRDRLRQMTLEKQGGRSTASGQPTGSRIARPKLLAC
jgi:hypothetical protein